MPIEAKPITRAERLEYLEQAAADSLRHVEALREASRGISVSLGQLVAHAAPLVRALEDERDEAVRALVALRAAVLDYWPNAAPPDALRIPCQAAQAVIDKHTDREREPEPPALKAVSKGCEEASPASHAFYIPCNRPAVRMIRHMNNEGPYRMCEMCADHNVKNRGAQDIGPYTDREPTA